MVFNFHNLLGGHSTSLGGLTKTSLSMVLFCRNADFMSIDWQDQLSEAIIFSASRMLSLLQVGESLKIS